MSTTLPADVTTWSDATKQSVFLALAKELISKGTTGTVPVVVCDNAANGYFVVGPITHSVDFIIDDSTEEMRELQRRRSAGGFVPLDPILDRLANDPR